MTAERGAIFAEEAYTLGKMLDHSSWQKGTQVLPRRITPSDIDMGFLPYDGSNFNFDNNGKIIFCELTRIFANWQNLRFGQRRFYENCISHAPHCAVLCQHNVPVTDHRQIDSREDIVAFQIMLFDFGTVFTEPYAGNENWQRFVFSWFKDPIWLRRFLLGRTIGKIYPK